MAHVWVQDAEGWGVVPLTEGDAVALTQDDTAAVRQMDAPTPQEAIITHPRAPERGRWVLLAAADARVRVNGRRLLLGVHVLRDKDEIRVGGSGPRFFSTEQLARVGRFQAGGSPTMCPRCCQEIVDGSPVVRCPGCGMIHHQIEGELPCWTGYDDDGFGTCARCDHPVSLDDQAAYRWTPEAL